MKREGGREMCQPRPMGNSQGIDEKVRGKQKGFMNIYFAGICVFILLVSMTLTGEAMKGRLKRREYEAMLQFDYRLEGYFLLLKSGSLAMDGETSYGSLERYELTGQKGPETHIKLTQTENGIRLEGYFNGKLRKTYEITP